MYHYHGSDEHTKRLRDGRCRCESNGTSYDLTELVVGGVIRDPRAGDQPLTSGIIGRQDKTNVFIFAVSREYRLRVAPDGDRNLPDAVKHETLFHNEPVLAAGEVHVVDGWIVDVNDQSGSYRTITYLETDPRFARELLRAITQNRIPATPVVLERLASLGGE